MNICGNLRGDLVERYACLLGGANQAPDQTVALTERNACLDEEICEICGPHRRVEGRGHPSGVHGEGVDRSRHRRQHGRQGIARVEQQRLVFLQILLIAGGNAFQRREQRDAVTQQPSRLPARQLEHVRIAFLRHEAGTGTEGV